jgi:hypothetical protein
MVEDGMCKELLDHRSSCKVYDDAAEMGEKRNAGVAVGLRIAAGK